jgi:hypothetical protein
MIFAVIASNIGIFVNVRQIRLSNEGGDIRNRVPDNRMVVWVSCLCPEEGCTIVYVDRLILYSKDKRNNHISTSVTVSLIIPGNRRVSAGISTERFAGPGDSESVRLIRLSLRLGSSRHP